MIRSDKSRVAIAKTRYETVIPMLRNIDVWWNRSTLTIEADMENRICPSCNVAGYTVTVSILIKAGSSRRALYCSACEYRWTVEGRLAMPPTSRRPDADLPVPDRTDAKPRH